MKQCKSCKYFKPLLSMQGTKSNCCIVMLNYKTDYGVLEMDEDNTCDKHEEQENT